MADEAKVDLSYWIDDQYRTLNKCFMSEKGCTFERDIREHIKQHNETNKQLHFNPDHVVLKAFVVMPFSPYMDQVYELQIKPFLSNITPKFAVARADSVMKTGNVMCEKICKEIQEADLVVAEITTASVNVLYEVGLSAGLGKKILLLSQKDAKGNITKESADILLRLDVPQSDYNTKYLGYVPFSYIQKNEGDLRQAMWQVRKPDCVKKDQHPKIGVLVGSRSVACSDDSSFYFSTDQLQEQGSSDAHGNIGASYEDGREDKKGERYDIAQVLECVLGSIARDTILRRLDMHPQSQHEIHLEKHIGKEVPDTAKRAVILRCIDRHIRQWRERKGIYEGLENCPDANSDRHKELKPYLPWSMIVSRKSDATAFDDMINYIEQCECLVIDTSPDAEPINFFWVGYAHAKGKHVIPIHICSHSDTSGHPAATAPFDVRGLWLVYFDPRQPRNLLPQFGGILNKIIADAVEKKVRRKFWKPFLNDTELGIIVGANKRQPDRYMVGEWDYLTLAKLVRFLSQAKPTLDIRIESPIYHPVAEVDREAQNEYHKYLKPMIEGRNCILIGSPAVNLATEMIFAKAKKVAPFKADLANSENSFCGYVAIYEEGNRKRGFCYRKDGGVYNFMSDYPVPEDVGGGYSRASDGTKHTFYTAIAAKAEQAESAVKELQIEELFGHMAIFENPYTKGKRILILSGISGPATMGMAQILTGLTNEDKAEKTLLDLLNSDVDLADKILHNLVAESQKRQNVVERIRSEMEKTSDEAQEDGSPLDPAQILYSSLWSYTQRSRGGDEETTGRFPNPQQTLDRELLEDLVSSPDLVQAIGSSAFDFRSSSETILTKVNESYDKYGEEVEALFYFVISNSPETKVSWRDPRRILYWELAKLPRHLLNPSRFVSDIQSILSKNNKWDLD